MPGKLDAKMAPPRVLRVYGAVRYHIKYLGKHFFNGKDGFSNDA